MPLKSLKTPTRSKCCVKGCATRICSGVPMHGFPRADKYPELYQHWVDAVRLANKTPFWIPRKSNRVCAFHFETIENYRIRVPTVFSNIDNQSPSPEGQSYNDLDDEDPTMGDLKDHSMDSYEASIAANSIMLEDDLMAYDDVENGSTSACGGYNASNNEDLAMTYEDIEERYNTIVGDVASTLAFDDNVMDEEAALMYRSDVEEQSTTPKNPKKTEQLGLNREELGDNDYCVVVVKQNLDEKQSERAQEIRSSEIQCEIPSKQIVAGSSEKSSKRSVPEKLTGKMMTIKAAKTLSTFLKQSSTSPLVEEPLGVTEYDMLAPNEEVKERLLNYEISQNDADTVQPQGKKSPIKEVPAKMMKIKPGSKEKSSNKKSPFKLYQKTEPSKGKNKAMITIKKTIVHQEHKMSPSEFKDEGTSPSKILQEKEWQQVVPSEGKEEVSSVATSSVEDEKQNPTNEAKEKKAPKQLLSVNKEELDGVKLGGLLLDGEPIKLKECSVHILKTPTKSISKKKAPSTPKVENVAENKEPSGSSNRDFSKVEDSGGPSDVLSALSLKCSEEGENEGTGLRRSARIRAGAGKRRKFGTKSSWSVAFKSPPKKKFKVEIDETSKSSECIPYDFEVEDEPEVGVLDLKGSDAPDSESDFMPRSEQKKGKSKMTRSGSDISSSSDYEPKWKPQPTMNVGGNREHGPGRLPSSTAEGVKRAKFHGYQRVRVGDQATQVGLPGKCEGFIFDVVRDDPRNVGLSCNIFYNYQPKSFKRCFSSWTKHKGKVNPAAAPPNGFKTPNSTDCNHSVEATYKHAHKSIDFTKEKAPSVAICENSYCLASTEELAEVLDNPYSQEDVNLDCGNQNDSLFSENTNSVVEIKVEPAMDVTPSVDKVARTSRKTGDINSMNAAEYSEVEVKEKEECNDRPDEGTTVDQVPCIVTDLCEVSHGDIENTERAMDCRVMLGTLSRPGVDQRNNQMEADAATRPECAAEQSSLVQMGEEAMDTDDASHCVQTDDAKNFGKIEISVVCASETTSLSGNSVQGGFDTIADTLAVQGVPHMDGTELLNDPESPKELETFVVEEGSEYRSESMALSSVHWASNKPEGDETAADSSKPAEYPSVAAITGPGRGSENVDAHIDSNELVEGVNPECLRELSNLAKSLKPPGVEQPGGPEPSEEPGGIQPDTGQVECLNAMTDTEMPAGPAAVVVTSCGQTDTKTVIDQAIPTEPQLNAKITWTRAVQDKLKLLND